MNEIEDSIGSPIKTYIKSIISQVQDALPENARVDGTLTIEMSTVLSEEKGGALKIEVLNIGAKVAESHVHKVTIPIRILTDTGKAVEKAMKAEAEATKAAAENKIKQYRQAIV